MKTYEVLETIHYGDSIEQHSENFTNKREALRFAKILVKQRNAGDVVTSNKGMKSVYINVTQIYSTKERLGSGLTGENIYHFDKEY